MEWIKSAESSAKELDKSMAKSGLVASAAFAGLVFAAKRAFDAYSDAASAQTRLNNAASLTMNATASQVKEIINLTGAYQKLGVVTATAQQTGAQELATYLTKTDSLKKLIPVMNDVAAQQHGFNVSNEQAFTIATMLGKVMDGQVGALSRYGYKFNEVQEEILKFGTEAERVAVLVEVVSSSIGGTNEALAKTDVGQMVILANEAGRAAEAFGGSLAPAVGKFSEAIRGAVSGFADFIENNKGLSSGLTATGLVVLGVTGLFAALNVEMVKTALAGAAVAAANPFVWLAGISIGGLVAYTTATIEQERKQAELNDVTKEYKELVGQVTTAENIAAKDATIQSIKERISAIDELIAKQKEEEEAYAKNLAKKDSYVSLSILETESRRELVMQARALEIATDDLMSAEELGLAIKKELAKEEKALSDQTKEYKNTLKEKTSLNQFDNEALKNQIKATQDLSSAVQTLNNKQDLSVDTLLELIQLYPSIAKHISENANWRENLTDVIKKEMETSKAATIAELEARKNELIAAKAKLVGVQNLNKDEAASYNAGLADRKRGLNDFANFMRSVADAISSKGFVQASVGVVDTLVSDFKQKALDEINKEIDEINAQIKAIGSIGTDIDTGLGLATSQKELNKALDDALKKLETEKSLKEMSAEDEIKRLEEIKNAHAKTQDEITSIEIKQHTLRGQVADQWYNDEIKRINKMTKDGADFSVINDELSRVLNEATATYGDEFPQRLAKITESINDMLTSNAEELAAKLAKIESDGVDQQIAEQERLRDVQKRSIGLTEDPQAILSANEARYKWLVENEKNLTEAQKTEMENRAKIVQSKEIENTWALINIQVDRIAELERVRKTASASEQQEIDKEIEERGKKINGYFNNIEDMTIDHAQKVLDINKKAIDDQAKADQKAADEQKKALEKQLKEQEDIRKQANKRVVDDIKDRYAKEIRLAEDAANAEIKIYSDKIKEIDDLLKSESRADTDADQLDKINRLKEQLKFETDETNIYELNKQISQEQADFDKRKRKESLEDEKSALQDKINAVKDSLAEQKQALQDLRDAEIKHAEESLENYIAKLSKENEQKKLAVEKETEIIKTELGNQETNNQTSIDKINEQETTGQDKKLEIVKTGTTNILTYLQQKLADFAAAGKAAGEAYAKAFNAEVESIMSIVSESGSTGGSRNTTNNAYNSYSLYNTFQMPVASPSKVSAETAFTLEQMTRIR